MFALLARVLFQRSLWTDQLCTIKMVLLELTLSPPVAALFGTMGTLYFAGKEARQGQCVLCFENLALIRLSEFISTSP